MQRALINWYNKHKRDLPWRRTQDPYAIWVSEIMLQQTQVDTVIPYYQRFLKRFPTIRELARASEDDVLALWSGLGYYRRARLLHRAAQIVAVQHNGVFPRDRAARLKLPGLGAYTAGAIASIAFNLPEPIVDGNVARVFSRYFGIHEPLGSRQNDELLWSHAHKLVPKHKPGDFNQALMELGATVCKKTEPLCQQCPIRRGCVAFAQNKTAQLPIAKVRKAPKKVTWQALLITKTQRGQKHVALMQNSGALYGGLWSLPTIEGSSQQTLKALADQLNIDVPLRLKPVAKLKHQLTHRTLTVKLYHIKAHTLTKTKLTNDVRWATLKQSDALALSTLTRRLLQSAQPNKAPLLSDFPTARHI